MIVKEIILKRVIVCHSPIKLIMTPNPHHLIDFRNTNSKMNQKIIQTFKWKCPSSPLLGKNFQIRPCLIVWGTSKGPMEMMVMLEIGIW